eukprot:scaffold228_cov312-Pinguiococcus_pyrenoidosus.AAC.39
MAGRERKHGNGFGTYHVRRPAQASRDLGSASRSSCLHASPHAHQPSQRPAADSAPVMPGCASAKRASDDHDIMAGWAAASSL